MSDQIAGAANPNTFYKWAVHACRTCGMGVLVGGTGAEGNPKMLYQFPAEPEMSSEVPEAARRFLAQANKRSPDAAVLMCASAVDAMLKKKGYTEGNLYTRIDAAVKAGVITGEVGAWAHNIRLDSNDTRHADLHATPATAEDAERCIDFTNALAQFLYVLPARVTRGRLTAEGNSPSARPADPS